MAKKQGTTGARKPTKATARNIDATTRFTKEERDAMRDHVKELKAARSQSSGDAERDVLDKIAAMAAPDRRQITCSRKGIGRGHWDHECAFNLDPAGNVVEPTADSGR